MLKDSYTIWLREMKKFFADKTNLITQSVWPIFLIFVLGIGIDSFADIKNLDTSYTSFLGPGVLTIMVVGWGMSSGVDIIEDKKKIVRRLLVAPVNRFSIVVGKTLSTLTTQFILTLVIILVLLSYNGFNLKNIPLAIFMLILISFGFSGFGLLFASLFKTAKAYQQISGFLLLGLYFLSGAFFPITNLPTPMKYLTYANPLTYGVDFVRWSITGVSEINITIDLIMVSAFSLSAAIIGSYLFDKNLRRR